MKALLALVLLSTIALPAMADDFACELKVGYFNRAKETAPYRGRFVKVRVGTMDCTGSIDNNIVVTTTLTSVETGESSVAADRGSSEAKLTALNQWGDGQDHGVCKCGLE
jgi:hypothetical protein